MPPISGFLFGLVRRCIRRPAKLASLRKSAAIFTVTMTIGPSTSVILRNPTTVRFIIGTSTVRHTHAAGDRCGGRGGSACGSACGTCWTRWVAMMRCLGVIATVGTNTLVVFENTSIFLRHLFTMSLVIWMALVGYANAFISKGQ